MALFDFLRPKWKRSDPQARIQGILELDGQEAQDREIIEALAADDPDESVRQAAADLLEEIRLLELESPTPLTSVWDPEYTVSSLSRTASEDPSPRIREAAQTSLVHTLIGAFTDPDGMRSRVSRRGEPLCSIQRLAVQTTWETVDERLVQPLVDLLQEAISVSDGNCMSEAMMGLGNQGDPRAVPVIVRVVQDVQRPSLQVEAAQALVKIGDPTGVQAAVEAGFLHRDPEIRAAIEEATDFHSILIIYELERGQREESDENSGIRTRHKALWELLRARCDPDVVKLLVQRFEGYSRSYYCHKSVIHERLVSLGPAAVEPLREIAAARSHGSFDSLLSDIAETIEGKGPETLAREARLGAYAQEIAGIAQSIGLEDGRARIVELGCEINEQFGLPGMQTVCHAVYHSTGNQGSISAWFNAAWDGIGQWRR